MKEKTIQEKENLKSEVFFHSWPELMIQFEEEEFYFYGLRVTREERGYIDDGKYSFKLTAEAAFHPTGFIEALQKNKGKAKVVYMYQDGRDGDGNDIKITRELEFADVNYTVVYRGTENLTSGKLTITLPGRTDTEQALQDYLNRRFETNDAYVE